MEQVMNKLSVIIPVYNQEVLIKKALESIPEECEIVVVDDGSTDGTMNTILEFRYQHPKADIIVLFNTENMGVGTAVNKALDTVTGNYVVLLGSDDYLYTDMFRKVMDQMDGTDLIYFNLRINSGKTLHLTPETKRTFCGTTKLMRRDIIGTTRYLAKQFAGEDHFFYKELLTKNPTEKFTGIVALHYNFPRPNSLRDLVRRGLIK